MISHEKLLALHSAMIECRKIAGEARGAANIDGASHADADHEAMFAGVALDLRPQDTLSASPDGMFARFVQDAAVSSGLATTGNGAAQSAALRNGHVQIGEVRGHTESPGSMRDSVAVDPLSLACTSARAHKAAKAGNIAVVFCENGTARPELWQKSLGLASRHNLPVVFVHSRTANQETLLPHVRRAQNPAALAFGVPVLTVDGDDAVAVYRVASESIARARQRRGPTLIESAISAHDELLIGPNSNHHVDGADPIRALENYLHRRKLFVADK